jgi:hypothetical protein
MEKNLIRVLFILEVNKWFRSFVEFMSEIPHHYLNALLPNCYGAS